MNLTDELQAAKEARRASRRALYRSCLSDVVSDLEGPFSERVADMWAMRDEDRGPKRKISGHPGQCAALFVSETFGEYNVPGRLRCFFTGMNREAGKGAHGITEGTILISVEMTPYHGMTQNLDVPVTVKNGYLLQPGLFLNHGVPYILAQSSIDELMKSGSFEPELKPDRKNMYSPPRTAGYGNDGIPDAHGEDGLEFDANIDVEGASPARPANQMTKHEMEMLKRQIQTGKTPEQEAAELAKQRRLRRNRDQPVTDPNLIPR